ARHVGSDRRVPERTRLLQRAPVQQQESGAARVSRRRTRSAGLGEPERSHGPLFRVLRSLPERRAGAEMDDRRSPVLAKGDAVIVDCGLRINQILTNWTICESAIRNPQSAI